MSPDLGAMRHERRQLVIIKRCYACFLQKKVKVLKLNTYFVKIPLIIFHFTNKIDIHLQKPTLMRAKCGIDKPACTAQASQIFAHSRHLRQAMQIQPIVYAYVAFVNNAWHGIIR